MKNRILLSLKKPVVIVGMLGSGKTTIGKKVAYQLKLPFYDTDKEIEEDEGMSIVEIYDYRGVEYFQKKELEVVKRTLNKGLVILSTGGSTFLNETLRNIIKHKAISIWLSADIETLYARIRRRNTRPEFNVRDRKTVLKELVLKRYPIYALADLKVKSQNDDVHFVVDNFLSILEKFLIKNNN